MGTKIRQAVILAGGKGERLKPLTDKIPKPMAPVAGKPFLDYLIRSIRDAGIQKVLLLVGYRSEVILNHYKHDPDISFSVGTEDDLTCKRVIDALDKLEDQFMLTYGDNYWPIELGPMLRHYDDLNPVAMTTVFDNRLGQSEYGFENNVYLNSKFQIEFYDRTRKNPLLNGVDIGYFIMRRSIFEALPKPGNPSLDTELIPNLVAKQELSGYRTSQRYYYMTHLESLADFERAVKVEGYRALGDR